MKPKPEHEAAILENLRSKGRHKLAQMVINMQKEIAQHEDDKKQKDKTIEMLFGTVFQVLTMTYEAMRDADALHPHYVAICKDFRLNPDEVAEKKAELFKAVRKFYK